MSSPCFLNRSWWACTMTPWWGSRGGGVGEGLCAGEDVPARGHGEAGGAESEECFAACGLLWGEGTRDVAGEGSELVGVDSCRGENRGAKDCAERSAGELFFAVHGGKRDDSTAVGVRGGCHWK